VRKKGLKAGRLGGWETGRLGAERLGGLDPFG